MAGAFINGPVTAPNLRVEQIFQLRQPLVPDSGLPVCVIGVNRQVVFEESIGAYDGASVDLPLSSLTIYSATLVELDAISYVDSDTGLSYATPSLPNVVFRHPQFGDKVIPKKDLAAGVLGWTFTQATGEFTLDASIPFIYSILAGIGDLSAREVSSTTTVNADAGQRTFISTTSDFIGAGVAAGDILIINGTEFTVVTVVNETTLVVQDLVDGQIPATTDLDDAPFTIQKTVTAGGGTVVVSYVANRADMLNSIIIVENDTVDELFGPETFLDPLGYYVRAALRNTGTTVLAVQANAGDLAGHNKAIETLSKSELPYDLVPLTQDEQILTNYIVHVNLQSDSSHAKERRVLTNFPLVIRETKALSGGGFQVFGLGGTNSLHNAPGTATFRVPAGQNNLHVLGVAQGDVVRDTTPGFEGFARITSIVPASAAPDADVALTLATPNTWKPFGTQANVQLVPTAPQRHAVRIDASTFATGDQIYFNVDGIATIFTAVVGAPATPIQITQLSAANMVAQLTAFYGTRLTVTNPAGTIVEIRDTYGAVPTARLIGLRRSAVTVSYTLVGGGAFAVNLLAGPDTPMPDDDAVNGIDDGDTFVLNDFNNVTQTYEYTGDQTTANGSLDGGNVQIQIGGPAMTATQVRDRTIEAINSLANPQVDTLEASAAATVPRVLITSLIAGTSIGAFAATGIPSGVPTAPLTFTGSTLGTGFVGPASPITSWEVTTQDLTVDQQATFVAQTARDLANRRVMNVWPDICVERFEDISAGDQGQQQGFGIFSGRTVQMLNVPDYGSGVAEMAARSNLLAADPLTKRPVVGPYRLLRVEDYFTQDQLDRILSTGNMLMEQPQGAGGTVQTVRGVTTDSTDLKVVEENVGAAVDKFTRLVRLTTKPIFGPNVIDPDGNFFDLFFTKVQSVIAKMTRRETREANDIQITGIRVNPDRKDSVIMTVSFDPLFAANDGLIEIFV